MQNFFRLRLYLSFSQQARYSSLSLSDYVAKESQIKLQLTGKVSLELDSNSSFFFVISEELGFP